MSQMIEFDDGAAKALERMYQTPDVAGQRAQVLAMLAPKPGEHVLDIGVGPGLLAYDLAQMVGEEGRMVGVDQSEAMVTMARTRCAALAQAEFLIADASGVDQPDEAFDAAVSTQVYEYVADMDAALRELRRLLKPGGRALILDTDWDSLVWHGSDRALMRRVLACWDDHLADPHLPATLGPKFRRTGFAVQRAEIVPMFSPSYQPHSYAAGIMRAIHRFVRGNAKRHGLSDDEVQVWYDDQLRLIERGDFFFSVNRYAFVALRV